MRNLQEACRTRVPRPDFREILRGSEAGTRARVSVQPWLAKHVRVRWAGSRVCTTAWLNCIKGRVASTCTGDASWTEIAPRGRTAHRRRSPRARLAHREGHDDARVLPAVAQRADERVQPVIQS